MYKNMVIFLKFWLNSGYWKSQKDFFFGTLSIIIIIISFLAIFSQIKVGKKKKGGCKFLLVPTLLIDNLAHTTTLLPWQLPQLANLFIFRNVEIFDIIIIIIIIIKIKNSPVKGKYWIFKNNFICKKNENFKIN